MNLKEQNNYPFYWGTLNHVYQLRESLKIKQLSVEMKKAESF